MAPVSRKGSRQNKTEKDRATIKADATIMLSNEEEDDEYGM